MSKPLSEDEVWSVYADALAAVGRAVFVGVVAFVVAALAAHFAEKNLSDLSWLIWLILFPPAVGLAAFGLMLSNEAKRVLRWLHTVGSRPSVRR